jgi:hypothetical protein
MSIIGFLLASACLSSIVQARPSIETHIISGGEVTIMEAAAQYDRRGVTVSGTGVSLFPRETCGYAEIMFVDAKGRTLLKKNALYNTSDWYLSSPRRSLMQDREVSFSVNVSVLTPTVTSVFVRHHSTGVCEHDWSFQSGLDLVIDNIIVKATNTLRKRIGVVRRPPVGANKLTSSRQQGGVLDHEFELPNSKQPEQTWSAESQ